MDQEMKSSSQHEITEQAVAWFLKIQNGLSQAGFREWRKWLAEDDSHAVAFDGINEFWRGADEIDGLPWPDDEELASDTYDGNARLSVPETTDVPVRQYWNRSRLWLSVAASVTTISLVVLFVSQGIKPETGSFQTATGEHQTIPLEDGSSITLGAASDIEFRYTSKVRQVDLRSGEAYFKVAKDSDRPFIVSAGTRTVRAIGTEFDINIGVRDIKVSVTQGLVRIEGPPVSEDAAEAGVREISNLSTGEVLDFNADGGLGIISEVDPMLTTSWMEGRLAYVGTSLESVIADVNRYSQMELIISDQSTKQLAFTGTIFSDDIDNWLAGLESVFPLRLVPIEDHDILLIQSNYQD